jgi:hypothetical protein
MGKKSLLKLRAPLAYVQVSVFAGREAMMGAQRLLLADICGQGGSIVVSSALLVITRQES